MYHSLLALLLCIGILSCGSARFGKAEGMNSFSEKSSGTYHFGKPVQTDTHLFKALNYKFNEKYKEASEELKIFIEKNPEEPVGYYQLAALQLEAFRDLRSALKNSKKAFELDNNNKWYRMQYADYLAYNYEFVKGAKLYENLTNAKDYQKDYFLKQIIFYEKAGEYNKMLMVIDTMDVYTDFEDDYLDEMRLEIYKVRKDNRNIEKVLTRMLARNPEDYSRKLLIAEFYQNSEQLDKADSIYQTIRPTEGDQDSEMAYIISLVQTKDTLKIRRLMDTAYIVRKDTSDMLFLQKVVAATAEEYPYLVKFYIRNLIQIAGHDHAHQFSAEFLAGYYSLMRNTDSSGYFSIRAFDLGSEDVTIYSQIISYYLSKEDYDGLIQYGQKTVARIDSFSIAYYGMGLAYTFKEENQPAIASLESALSVAGNFYLDNFKSEIYSLIGDAHHRMKHHQESDQAYDSALNYNPRNATALNNYAYYLSLRNERLTTALEMSEKSLTIEENQPSYLDTYGWIHYQLGNYEEAQQYIRKAIELSPSPSAELWEHLGDVELKLGNIVKAKELWKIAIESGGNAESLNQKIQEHE